MTQRVGDIFQARVGHISHTGVGLDVHWGPDLQGKNP
jgi:hypothetical protein